MVYPVDRWNECEGGGYRSLVRWPVGQAIGQRISVQKSLENRRFH